MNKEQIEEKFQNRIKKINKLTWEYFMQQKAKELFYLVAILGSVVVLSLLFFQPIRHLWNIDMTSRTGEPLGAISIFFVESLIGFAICLMIIGVVLLIYQFFKSNYDKANKRAIEEVFKNE